MAHWHTLPCWLFVQDTVSRPSRFLVVSLLSMLATVAWALQVAVTPAPMITGKVDNVVRMRIVLSQHFADALERTPGITVVDEAWTAAVVGELREGRRVSRSDSFFADLSADLPVDAYIDVVPSESKLTCVVYTQAGAQTRDFSITRASTDVSLARDAGAFIATALKLSPDAVAKLEAAIDDNSALFTASLLSQRVRGEWVTNTGDARFKLLDPFLGQMHLHPVLVRAVLAAGMQLSQDDRKPEKPDYQLLKARTAMMLALGTSDEPLALEFLRVNRHATSEVEKDLVGAVKAFESGMIDELLGKDTDTLQGDTFLAHLKPTGDLPQVLGAIRGLGILRAKSGLSVLLPLAKHQNATVRAAVAQALVRYTDPKAQAATGTVSRDEVVSVAFQALGARWREKRGEGMGAEELTRLVALARTQIVESADTLVAAQVLSSLGDAGDAARLTACLSHANPVVRQYAIQGLVRLQALQPALYTRALRDSAVPVVMAAVRGLPTTEPEMKQRLIRLANNPYTPLAEAARQRAQTILPTAEPDRTRMLLEIEHPYIRRKLVEKVASEKTAVAAETLRQVADRNKHPHVRALAMVMLAEREPAVAAPLVRQALNDPYQWVRFRAAALTPALAKMIGSEALRAAQATNPDEAIQRYLTEAIALADGLPQPPAPRAANALDPKHSLAGLCGHGPQAPSSPIQLYYNLSAEIDEPAKQASDKGKVFLCRVRTAPNPCQVMLDPIWDDLAWRVVRDGLANWQWIDGVIIGEETMYARTNDPNTWRNGWRAFCWEAGIDEERIQGDRSKLTPAEQQAWEYWEQRIAIEGFNELYDFTKLYFGKLRPGFMVGTFMPDQDSLKPLEHTWKFDIGGAYYYGTSNRERYAMVRRYRTVWPDRPVVWLSMGEGAIHGDVRYNLKVPEAPVLKRNGLAYSDSVCAWMAGAEPGLFLSYLFQDPNSPGGFNARGKWVFLEDVAYGAEALTTGIENAFSGVLEVYKKQAITLPDAPDDPDAFDLTPDTRAQDEKALVVRIEREKQRMHLGFLLEQRYLYNVARVLADLPRPESRAEVLWVTSARRAEQLEWSNQYDIQYQVNNTAEMPLSRYRFIGVLGMDKAPLRDATIDTLSRWVREQPGLLYIRGALSTDNGNAAVTPADISRPLTRDWPWEKDVICQEGSYRATGAARVLAGTPDAATLVYWQGEGCKGGVVFDLTPNGSIREQLAALMAERKVGTPLDGIPGMKTLRMSTLTAAVATGGEATPLKLRGVDLLTGEPNPVVEKGRMAAIVAETFQGRYVVVQHGVAVLGEQPLEKVAPVEGGVTVQCRGLLQVGAVTGHVRAVTAAGRPLPPIVPDRQIAWIINGTEEGIITVPVGNQGAMVTYIRCQEAITLTTAEK